MTNQFPTPVGNCVYGSFSLQKREKMQIEIQNDYLNVALKFLSLRDKKVLAAYYGFRDDEGNYTDTITDELVKEIGFSSRLKMAGRLNQIKTFLTSTKVREFVEDELYRGIIHSPNELKLSRKRKIVRAKQKSTTVRSILERLPDDCKQIAVLYYGIDCPAMVSPEIRQRLNLAVKQYEKRFSIIQKTIKDPDYVYRCVTRPKRNSRFGKINKDVVSGIFDKLPNEVRNVAKLYYGLNCRRVLVRKEIANMLSISTDDVARALKIVYREIYPKKPKTKVIDNVDVIKMKKFIDSYRMKTIRRAILCSFYGLDGSPRKSIREISDSMNIDYVSVENTIYKYFKKYKDANTAKEP